MDRACDGCKEQMHCLFEFNGKMLCSICYEIEEDGSDTYDYLEGLNADEWNDFCDNLPEHEKPKNNDTST